jgi:hypothetical protein
MITENDILMALEEIERCPNERKHDHLERLLADMLSEVRKSRTFYTNFIICKSPKIWEDGK